MSRAFTRPWRVFHAVGRVVRSRRGVTAPRGGGGCVIRVDRVRRRVGARHGEHFRSRVAPPPTTCGELVSRAAPEDPASPFRAWRRTRTEVVGEPPTRVGGPRVPPTGSYEVVLAIQGETAWLERCWSRSDLTARVEAPPELVALGAPPPPAPPAGTPIPDTSGVRDSVSRICREWGGGGRLGDRTRRHRSPIGGGGESRNRGPGATPPAIRKRFGGGRRRKVEDTWRRRGVERMPEAASTQAQLRRERCSSGHPHPFGRRSSSPSSFQDLPASRPFYHPVGVDWSRRWRAAAREHGRMSGRGGGGRGRS